MLLASQAGSFVIRTREVVLPGPNQVSAECRYCSLVCVWGLAHGSHQPILTGLPGQEEQENMGGPSAAGGHHRALSGCTAGMNGLFTLLLSPHQHPSSFLPLTAPCGASLKELGTSVSE